MSKMPRIQSVVLPILRARFSDWQEHQVGSWVEDIDFRTFPLINVRRFGGPRHATRPKQLAFPTVELTVYDTEDLETTEEIYEDALEALYDAVKYQIQTPAGYLHSINETMGATQLDAPFMDSWRVQGLIRLGVRPPRYT